MTLESLKVGAGAQRFHVTDLAAQDFFPCGSGHHQRGPYHHPVFRILCQTAADANIGMHMCVD